MANDRYISPFSTRYASDEMQYLFSADKKYKTWRKLWIALAEAEQRVGLPVTDAQIEEMKAHADSIDYEKADAYEKELRHDVMAHIHAFGDECTAEGVRATVFSPPGGIVFDSAGASTTAGRDGRPEVAAAFATG